MADEMDDLDRQILAVLESDGRTPVAQIAEKVGLSRPAVSERIDRLQKSGVIRGTTTVVAPRAMGKTLTAFVTGRVRDSLGLPFVKAFNEILEDDEVVEVHTIAGEDCYLIKVRTDAMSTLNAFVNRLQAPPLSMTTRTTIVMETHCEKIGGVRLAGGECNAEG